MRVPIPKAVAYQPEFRGKRRRIIALVEKEEEDDARAKELAKWTTVLEANLPASSVGRQLIQMHGKVNEEELMTNMLKDVFAKKATNTLVARATAVLLYIKWASEKRSGSGCALPIKEDVLYEYFSSLRKEAKPASRANSLMEAWAFCVGVLGFDDVHEALTSKRCLGAAHRLLMTKGPRRRKAALEVCHICALEVTAVFADDIWVKVVAGFCCTAALGARMVTS